METFSGGRGPLLFTEKVALSFLSKTEDRCGSLKKAFFLLPFLRSFLLHFSVLSLNYFVFMFHGR